MGFSAIAKKKGFNPLENLTMKVNEIYSIGCDLARDQLFYTDEDADGARGKPVTHSCDADLHALLA
jgi:hypothetical protein